MSVVPHGARDPQLAAEYGKGIDPLEKYTMVTYNAYCFHMPITVQAGVRVPYIVGCAVRTESSKQSEDSRCAQRTLRSLSQTRCSTMDN